MLTTLQSQFSNAENDLREKVDKAMETMMQPLNIPVPIAAFCSKSPDGRYRVSVSSAWLPGQLFQETFDEATLRNLEKKWQNFSNNIAKAFVKGPLNFKTKE